jgi:hypothetical protein
MALSKLPEDVHGLIRSFAPDQYPIYQYTIYKEAMHVLGLKKWTALYEQLESDNTEHLNPLLLEYQSVVKDRMQADQVLLDYYTGVVGGRLRGSPEEIDAEGARLSHLYAQQNQKEIRLFEQLTEQLYGKPKKRWELHEDMVTLAIGEIPTPICRHYQVYVKAKRILGLKKWTTLFEKLHTDSDAILPPLAAYQDAVVERINVDEQFLTYFTRRGFKSDTEQDRLIQLVHQRRWEEDQCFAKLSKVLYGIETPRWKLHDDMENKSYYNPKS